ncbi:MAG: tRNA (adenosine(37)-N6)-threonylcarbamoyltransferase complex dimerization subunit type 1 TsaB [Fibrobacter sp.]|jgi:tRNA threonylcarbamoyladenosine biosynthesis protein TsaB|nr:tRNA (adenosine(37)-N6)-threonylcarbamoyltransferase complex dimerization subunit type 1 TsaB [Fibrobacter sp.]
MTRSLDLILDTSRQGIAMGLYSAEGETISEIFEPDARGENLETLLDRLLEKGPAALSEVKRLLVTLGPGSFTGLRTGIAFGQGLCFSGNRALYGVSTLKALKTLSQNPEAASVILKARPGYWYLGNESGEFFLSTETLLEQIDVKNYFVCDADAWALLKERVKEDHLILSRGSEIQPFTRLFSELTPNLVQEANYIQPSYFQKSGS